MLPGVTLMQQRHEDPCACTHVPIMSNFFPVHIPVCTHVQILFEKRGNLMVIVMNVDLADQKSRRRKKKKKKGNAGESCEEQKRVCLDARVSLGFMRRNDLGGKHDYFFPSAFSSYTGESSATRRQGAPSTRIIRRFFTSDKQAIWLSLGLFEENMFLHRTPGSPTSGKK